MKKFLKKKEVMITFIALAVIMLVAYIGLLVRPVAIGMTYKGEVDMMGGGEKTEMTIKVTSGSKLLVRMAAGEGVTMEMDGIRYVVHDRQIYFGMDEGLMTNKEFKQWKKDIIKNWDYYKEKATDINAFTLSEGSDTLTCVGSIVFAALGGVVLVALITFGSLSVIYCIKGKNKA